ncbi:hypothetical protein SAMN04487843_108214 [Methylobacterium sp. ap11]|nr:hypothetical protein SAMN04487843_108214 [Methylobacterium sp. ap11]
MLVADEVDHWPPGTLGGPIVLTPAQQAFIERMRAMRLREKGKTDGEPVTMGWDEAQAALAAGTHEVAEGSDNGAAGGDTGAAEGGAEQGGDNFDALTRPELEAIAAERGIDVSKAKAKADVVQALRAAR